MAPLSLPLAWFLALATPGQLSPEKQGTSFTVSPGLEFKIWAELVCHAPHRNLHQVSLVA